MFDPAQLIHCLTPHGLLSVHQFPAKGWWLPFSQGLFTGQGQPWRSPWHLLNWQVDFCHWATWKSLQTSVYVLNKNHGKLGICVFSSCDDHLLQVFLPWHHNLPSFLRMQKATGRCSLLTFGISWLLWKPFHLPFYCHSGKNYLTFKISNLFELSSHWKVIFVIQGGSVQRQSTLLLDLVLVSCRNHLK